MADTRKMSRSSRKIGIEGPSRLNDLRAMDRWDARDADYVLSMWKAAGVSLMRFSRDTGISYKRLTQWKRRLSNRVIESTPFVEVVIPKPNKPVPNQLMEVILKNNRAIRLHPGFDSDSVRSLIGLLEVME